MKRQTNKLLTLLITLVLLGLGLYYCSDDSTTGEEQKGKTLEFKAVIGNVLFTHEKHQKEYSKGCDCHTKGNFKKIFNDTIKISIKDKAHKYCKDGCHKSQKIARCENCHQK